jgi:catecholate siderophore receptor
VTEPDLNPFQPNDVMDSDAPVRRPRSTTLAEAVARALIGSSLIFGPARPSMAQAAADESASSDVEEIVVVGVESDRVEESAIGKLTEPLRDTPQGVTALSATVIDDRNLTSLNDALRTVPSITLGAGEFSWQGNNPNIRGFNARDDMYLDGIRDFGSYARDPFNLQAVEVLLGPSSVLFGRGSTGGAINQVSKRATLEPITDFNANLGSDQTFRSTMDIGRPISRLGEGAAFRVNVLAHSGEVADRDGAEAERYGFAPTLSLGLGSATELTLSYMKQMADDRPDYGLPWLDGHPAPVPRQSFYGFDSDYLETDADLLSGQLDRQHRDGLRSSLQLRYARYSRRSRITEPLITDPNAPGMALEDISVFRYVFLGDSDESLLTAQGTVTADFRLGRVQHTMVGGFELSSEQSEPEFAFGIGVPGTSLLAPNHAEAFYATSIEPRVRADTRGDTTALFALDTIKLGDAWQLVAGLRWDRFDTNYDAERFAGSPTPFNAGDVAGTESIDQSDTELSYRAAVVYKPSADKTWYFAGSTSFNPSAQSLSQLSTGRGLGTSNASLDPEENQSLELGFKSDLLDGDLAFAAALFEISKTNARVPDPTTPGFNTLGGEQRVRGFSVDVTGLVGPRLYVLAGYTYLDSEVVRAAPGAATGAELANAPEHSLSLWADYQLRERIDVGLGARYVSEVLAQNTGAGKQVPGYHTVDAMARYHLSDTMTVKLNLSNLTDEYYFEQLHPWHVIPGAGRALTVAVNFSLAP